MKKILSILTLYLLLSGYTFPNDAPYIIVNSNRGTNEKIYFAENMVEYIHISGSNVVSSYSGTLYGYSDNNNTYYWPCYDTPYYREGYSSIDFNITEVVEVNLYPSEKSVISKNYEIYLIALLGGLCIICLFKK